MKKNYVPEIHIFAKHGQLFTTSIDVAEKFGKMHSHVLWAIRKICVDSIEINEPKSRLVNEPKIAGGKHLTTATYKALFIVTDKFPGSFRDFLNTAQLSFLATAEHVTAKALQDGMAQGLFYKDIYPLAKSRLEALAMTVGVSQVVCQQKQMLITEARA